MTHRFLGALAAVLLAAAAAPRASAVQRSPSVAEPVPTPTPTCVENPAPEVQLLLTVEPPEPRVGETVRISIETVLGAGFVGIPSYHLYGAAPFLAGDTGPQSFNWPMSVTYELQAVHPGTTELYASVDFETRGGCEDEPYFYFQYVESAHVPLTVGLHDVTPSPTPPRPTPVDTEVHGTVYDAGVGPSAPIADAEIEYQYLNSGMPIDPSGALRSDAAGQYRFTLPLVPSGVIAFTVDAPGFATFYRSVSATELIAGAAADFGLAPRGGIAHIEPATATLQCGGSLDITISNVGPPDETLVILVVSLGNGYSQGYYGTGFRWDLSGIELPIRLASGEQFSFPVFFDSAGQQFPSRLELQLVSGARAGTERALYYGRMDDCDPTPTPTMTPAPQATGDLGTKQVQGRVYDALHGSDAGIAGAAVSYIAPHGTGTVQTDDHGDFSFPLFLHDTDLITIHAAASGFRPAEVHFGGYGLWTTPLVAIGLEYADPAHHRVTGHVQRDPYCPSGATVTLSLTAHGGGEPAQTIIVPASDEFAFEDVADGDYSISARSDCQLAYAPPVSASVRGADVTVEVVFEQWCPPVVLLDPDRGAPGSSVHLSGRCYYIHSGGAADIAFDTQPIAQVRGDTSGYYDAQITVPADASAGRHDIRVTSSRASGGLIGSAPFLVAAGPSVPCAGDCNGDGEVTIDELVTGVRQALDLGAAQCAAVDTTGDGEVAIDELVAAVANALHGCE